MSIRANLDACSACIRLREKAAAKKYFDLAYKEYIKNGCSNTEHRQLFWLMDNFYPTGGGITFSEEGEYWLNRILERQERNEF